LSPNESKKVIAPMPWFAALPEPKGLVPPEFTRMDAGYPNERQNGSNR
jgi:hypothetical protein